MTDRKFCKRCGVLISDLNNNADWFSHIRIQYCDICRKDSEREKTAARTSVTLSNSLRKDEDAKSKIATSLLKAQD